VKRRDINMEHVINILNQIKETSSRNDKEQILKDNKDNDLLKDVLKFLYNPFVVTGVSTKKINKKVTYTDRNREIYNIYDLMNYLKKNNSGRDCDLEQIQVYIDHVKYNEKEFIKQFVTKSLKIGLTSNTLNKVYGKGFIPNFGCMLAEKFTKHENKINGEFIITPKLDGLRMLTVFEDGDIKFFSRTGQLIDGLDDIKEDSQILNSAFDTVIPDFILDGELIAINDENLNSADLFRKTMKLGRKDGIKKGLEYHVFDMIDLTRFKDGFSDEECKARKQFLSNIVKNVNSKLIKEVPILYQGNDKTVIPKLLEEVLKDGKEGLMLNIANAPYECKRTKNLLKIKTMQTVDLEIVGFEEGTGKYEGMLGSIVVDYKGFKVNVGSGFTNEDRIDIWNNKDEYMGRIVEVSYFEESTNQNDDDSLSLRFPIFKCIREIGKEVSYN
jgi:DNA ligase-1